MAEKTTRRKFLATAAVAGTAALATTELASAAQAADPAPPAQLLTDVVRRRFGKHLTEAQLKRIETGIAEEFEAAEALKRIRLENGDEPALVFVPDVE